MKRMLKYVLFTFLLFLMCGINVKATTEYTLCDYEAKNNTHTIRLFYANQQLYYISAKNSIGGNWDKFSDDLKIKSGRLVLKNTSLGHNDSAIKLYDSDEKSLKKNLFSIMANKCPTINVSGNAQDDKSLKADEIHVFDVPDLTCKYGSENAIWEMKSTFAGIKDLNSSNFTFTNAPEFSNSGGTYAFRQLLIQDGSDVGEDGYPTKLDGGSGYSKQTYMYNYLKSASKYGCPRSIFAGNNGDYVTSAFGNKGSNIYYLTYKWAATNNDITNVNPQGLNENYKVYKLVCNTDVFKEYTDYMDEMYTTKVDALKKYENASYWENWEAKMTRTTTACFKEKKKDKAITCYLKEKADQSSNDYVTAASGYYAIKAKQAGCDNELKEYSTKEADLKQNWSALTQKLVDSKLISEEDKKIIDGTVEENLSKISDAKSKLFGVDSSKLEKLKENKTEKVNCNDIFGAADDETSPMYLIIWIFNILKILIPVLLIILGSIDFGKVVLSNDKDAMSKAISTFVIRIIIAIAIFLLPTLVSLILQILGDAGVIGKDVISCVIGEL